MTRPPRTTASSRTWPTPSGVGARIRAHGPLHSRPAFLLADTLIGLIVAGVLGLVLVVSITKAGQAHRRLDDSATAVRIAQRVMATLHEGHPAPQQLDGATITLQPTPGGTSVPNHTWVQVQVTYNGRQASLVGLIPQAGAQ